MVTQWATQAEGAVSEDSFVFSPYVDGSTPFCPDNVTNFFIRVRDSLALKAVRLHDLRHGDPARSGGSGIVSRYPAHRNPGPDKILSTAS